MHFDEHERTVLDFKAFFFYIYIQVFISKEFIHFPMVTLLVKTKGTKVNK